ncbi:hypothetical protein GOODEAATRI_017878, partial [Goodea atripinnis]
FSKEDMAKSLLHMISNDIGQLACLYAKLHNLSRVYFGGFFIRGHPVTMHTITYSINFFTKVSPYRLMSVSPDMNPMQRARSGTIKERENDIALKYYQKAVKSLEELSWEDRQFALVRGVLAGNVFDWGAKAVSESALREDSLTLIQSGSSSPCLDLSRLDKVLAMVVRERQTDLVIIEGMGRAIHTNYYAMLSCESLKMAVIKNSWLADRLGGKLFSVVFKYEVPAGKPH